MVFDEADALIDSGYDQDLAHFMRIVTNPEVIEQRGSAARAIFVSATLGGSLREFLKTVFGAQNSPRFERVIDSSTHLNLANIRHDFIHLPEFDKHKSLEGVVKQVTQSLKKNGTKAIVFCESVKSAQSTEYFLQQMGHETVSLHGDVPARLRVQNYERFQKGDVNLLVATDVGGRGLDFKKVSHVINFDFPQTASDYLHRVGRTGRAGQSGTAISLYRNSDLPLVNKLRESYEKGIPLLVTTSTYGKINKEILANKDSKKALKSNQAQLQIEKHNQAFEKIKALESRAETEKSNASKEKKRIINFKKMPHSKLYRAERALKNQLKSVPKNQRHQKQNFVRYLSNRLRSITREKVKETKKK